MLSSQVNRKALNRLRRHSFFLRLVGWFLTLACGIIAIAGFFSSKHAYEYGYVMIFLALAVLGVWMIRKGTKGKSLALLTPTYAARLADREACGLNTIAASVGQRPDVFRANLTKMIKIGVFTGTMPPEEKEKAAAPNAEPIKPRQIMPEQYTVVICPSCGARNKIAVNTVSESEYCNGKIAASAIKYK